MNFGVADFYKVVPQGEISPLAGTVAKSSGSWERLWRSGRESEGSPETRLSRPMEQSTWVLAAVDLIIRQITAQPLVWLRDESTMEALPAEPDRAGFWREPARTRAGRLTSADVMELAGAWMLIRGVAYFVMDDSWLLAPGRGQRTPFMVARPDQMRPIEEGGPGGEVVGWEWWDSRGRREWLLPEQVVAVRKQSLYDDINGLGAYLPAAVAAEADVAAGKFARNVAASNGSKGEYVVTDGAMPTAEQRDAIVAQLREKKRRVANGDFAPTFLPGGLKIEDAAVSAVDAAFVTQRIENRREISAAFGVPMSFADPKASYSLGADSDSRQLVWGASMPLAAKLARAFAEIERRRTGKILHAAIDWTTHPVMQAVLMSKLDAVAKLAERGVPMRDINQLLDLGLPRFEGDEIGFIPFGVQPMRDALGTGDNSNDASTAAVSLGGSVAADATPVQAAFMDLARALQARSAAREAKAIEVHRRDAEAQSTTQGRDGTPLPSQTSRPALRIVGDFSASLSRQAGSEEKECPQQPETHETRAPSKARKNLWNRHQSRRVGTERKLESSVRKVFGRFRAIALDALAKWGDSFGYQANGLDASLPVKQLCASASLRFEEKAGGFSFVLNLTDLQEALTTATTPVIQGTLARAGQELFEEVGKDNPFTMAPPKAKAFVTQRENLIKGSGEEVFNAIQSSLREGWEAGETMDQLAERVKAEFASASSSRARTIAATETATAYNFSRDDAMRQAGVIYKEWLSSHDDRVREEHVAADGQIVPMDQPFTLQDGTQLMFPGAQGGPAHQVINCRCLSIAAIKEPDQSDV